MSYHCLSIHYCVLSLSVWTTIGNAMLSYQCLSYQCSVFTSYCIYLSVIQCLYIQFCPIIVCILKNLSNFVCLIIVCLNLSVLSLFCLYFFLSYQITVFSNVCLKSVCPYQSASACSSVYQCPVENELAVWQVSYYFIISITS